MDLKEKLKYYESAPAKKKSENRGKIADIYKKLDAIPVDPDAADVLKIEKFYAYSHFFHESYPSSRMEIRLPLLSRNRLSDPINLNDILIFDLETTGLAGGAGTFPFLIGLGVFEEDGVRVYQYFLPEYGREIIAYLDLAKYFSSKTHLLTYNGKSFDYPLIKNRFILNRIDNPFISFQHIDLLHYARRLWRSHLPNCSLATVEREIFRFHRYGDIEGWLIPQAYFDFLQTGSVDQMQKIIHHNQQDILSLGRLIIYMHQIELENAGDQISDNELQVLFGLAIRNDDFKRTSELYHQVLNRKISLSGKMAAAYSMSLKRQNRWQDAVSIWHDMLESQSQILFALEELAKYYEHHKKDHIQARKYTERGIKYIDLMQELDLPESYIDIRHSFAYRLERILRKIS